MKVVIAAESLGGGGAGLVAGWIRDALEAEGHDTAAWIAPGGLAATWSGALLRRRQLAESDVVHLHHRKLELALRLLPRRPPRVLLTLHHAPRSMRWLAPAVAVTAPARHVLDAYGRPDGAVIPSPVLHRWRRDSSAATRILYVGRVQADKGWAEWLRVLWLIRRQRPVSGVVYGDGRDLRLMQAAAKDAELPVEFRGWVHPSDISAAGNDVLVFPSEAEADPLAPWEALTSGVPVVARRIDAFREVADAIILADDGDGMASAALHFIEQPAARAAVVTAAAPHLSVRHPAEVIRAYLMVYEHLLAGRPARRRWQRSP